MKEWEWNNFVLRVSNGKSELTYKGQHNCTWDCELTDSEVSLITSGVHPLAVRSQKLKEWNSLVEFTKPE